jgi:hypothetical protein
MQNVIRNTIAREIRLSSNGHLIEPFIFRAGRNVRVGRNKSRADR